MDELFPIIRRKRRPLLPVEPVPAPLPAGTETDKTDVTHGSQTGEASAPASSGTKPKPADDEAA